MTSSLVAEASTTNEALLSITGDLRKFVVIYEALKDSIYWSDVGNQRLEKWTSFYNEIGNLNIRPDSKASVFIADSGRFDFYANQLEVIASNIVGSISNPKNQLPNYFSNLLAAYSPDVVQNMTGDLYTNLDSENKLFETPDVEELKVNKGVVAFLQVYAIILLLIGEGLQFKVKKEFQRVGKSVTYEWLVSNFSRGTANVVLGQFSDLAAVTGWPFLRAMLTGKKGKINYNTESVIRELNNASWNWITIELLSATGIFHFLGADRFGVSFSFDPYDIFNVFSSINS